MPKIIHVQKKMEKLKQQFFKMPIGFVEDHYIGIARFKGRYRLHYHNRDELLYVLDGELIIFVNDRKYVLQPGEAILITKGERHVSCSDKETRLLIFEPQDITITFLEDE